MSALALELIRTDGGTQTRAALYENVVTDYANAMGEGATFPPVVVFHDGETYWLADGFHRHGAHKQCGLVEIEADIRQGTRRDAVLYSVGANSSHGLRRTNEDKRRAVLLLLGDSEWAKWSDREIAKHCQVDGKTVAKLRESLTADFRSDERTFTTKHGTVATMDTSAIGRSRFDPHQASEILTQAKEIATVDEGARRDLMQVFGGALERPYNLITEVPHVRGTLGTGENEWFTPEEHIAFVRKVLDKIDLDPASNPLAQKVVKAKTFYTEADNGLAHEWRGKVFLNPPYAQPAIAHFADKMVEEVNAGRVIEAIMLTHNYTDTAWFQKLAGCAAAICFTRGRIRFVSPDGELASPTQGQAFFYFGMHCRTFIKVFKEVGFVVEVRA